MRAIVTYHSIDDSGSPISIDAVSFRRHVEWLVRHGPRVVPLDQLVSMRHESAIAITFDDAFANFAQLAWPLLREHGLPVTLYVPSDHVGGSNRWSANDRFIPKQPLLDWDALARLADEGVVLGSHTCSHPHLPQLSDERVRNELAASADAIEQRTGTRPRSLAYPYGSHDDRIVRAAALLYEQACTTELRVLHDAEDAHRLPRLDAYYLRREGALESWGTPTLRLYLRARSGARRWREMLIRATAR